MTSDSEQPPPTLCIVRGAPTPEELAAVTTVVRAAGEGVDRETSEARPHGRWNDPAYGHRRYWSVGIGGWRNAL